MFDWQSWLVTDPLFYVLAVPAVLLIGISKSGFGAGFGALGVPLMAIAVPVPQAASIMMPVLLVMDLFGLRAYRRDYDPVLLRFMLPFGLLGIGVGFLTFRILDAHWVAGLVGISTLLFLAQRLLFPPQAIAKAPPRPVGAVLTMLSGFTSFIAHAGSPPINAYLLPMRLPPVTFAATLTVFFFIINLSKWVPFAYLDLLDPRNMVTGLALTPLAPLGVWLGVRIAQRISPEVFYRFVYWGMGLTGVKLVWDAFH